MKTFKNIEKLVDFGFLKSTSGLTLLEDGEFTHFAYEPVLKTEKDLAEFYQKNNSEIQKQEAKKEKEIIEKIKLKKSKLRGFKFNGVMCSLTKDDQNGIAALAFAFDRGYIKETNFVFENGTILPMDAQILDDFARAAAVERNKFFAKKS